MTEQRGTPALAEIDHPASPPGELGATHADSESAAPYRSINFCAGGEKFTILRKAAPPD
jgi:hypothetical protein